MEATLIYYYYSWQQESTAANFGYTALELIDLYLDLTYFLDACIDGLHSLGCICISERYLEISSRQHQKLSVR